MSATIIALSIAITFAACLIRFAVWVMFPRTPTTDQHEMLTADWEKRS